MFDIFIPKLGGRCPILTCAYVSNGLVEITNIINKNLYLPLISTEGSQRGSDKPAGGTYLHACLMVGRIDTKKNDDLFVKGDFSLKDCYLFCGIQFVRFRECISMFLFQNVKYSWIFQVLKESYWWCLILSSMGCMTTSWPPTSGINTERPTNAYVFHISDQWQKNHQFSVDESQISSVRLQVPWVILNWNAMSFRRWS